MSTTAAVLLSVLGGSDEEAEPAAPIPNISRRWLTGTFCDPVLRTSFSRYRYSVTSMRSSGFHMMKCPRPTRCGSAKPILRVARV